MDKVNNLATNTKITLPAWFITSITILITFIGIGTPVLLQIRNKSYIIQCKSNLSQIGKSIILYKQSYGHHKRYPAASGSKFICSVFFKNILVEKELFLCPNTSDTNTAQELLEAGNIDSLKDNTITSAQAGPTSYAGRKNNNYKAYPGLFNLRCRGGTGPITPVGSDDWKGPEGYGNHEQGKLVNFLFSDAHVNDMTIDSVRPSLDHGYSLFQVAAYPDINNPNLADPLTN